MNSIRHALVLFFVASSCFAQDAPRMEAVARTGYGGVAQLASERKEITLPVATLSKYVGTYELAPGVNMLIRLDGDRLTTQLSGQQEFAIFAESDTKFFLKVVEAQVEFFTDANGVVTHAVMYQNGRERKVPRTSATVAPPVQHKETTVAAATLAGYVGAYQTPFDAVAVVVAFQLRVVLFEEPWLARAHGAGWQRYKARVRCWV